MKKNNILLWSVVLLFAGAAFWILSTGRLEAFTGSFLDEVWSSLEGMIRPVFRR